MAVVVLIAVSLFAAGCTSSRNNGSPSSKLDDAIALFIDGDYAGAQSLLQELTQSNDSDEATLTAWLYLGRTYMAMGEYSRAAQAFSTGSMLGGGQAFEAYLGQVQQHLQANPRTIRNRATVTRAQLAALLAQASAREMNPRDTPPSAPGANWASVYIERVRAARRLVNQPQQRRCVAFRQHHSFQMAHFGQKITFVLGQIVTRPQVGDQPQRAERHLARRNRPAGLREQQVHTRHAQERGLAGHVRSGDHPHARLGVEPHFVGHDPLRPNQRMAAVRDSHARPFHRRRVTNARLLVSEAGQAAQRFQIGQRGASIQDSYAVCDGRLEHRFGDVQVV